MLSHIFKPLPNWVVSGAGVAGAVMFSALPGNGILVALLIAVAILAALSAVWRHIDVEHEHSQTQRLEKLERRQECNESRATERFAAADRAPLTTPLNALAVPARRHA